MFITIQSGQPDDRRRDFFRRHWLRANQEIFGWQGQERWVKQYTTLSYEEKGQIQGAALFWKLGGVGYLQELLVDEAQRGRGIGRKLVAAFEGECVSCHKLALKTYKDSSSQKLYGGLGYTVEAVVEQDIHGIDWVYMQKRGWPHEGR